MTDTQYLRFSLKENATIFTTKLSTTSNGQVLKFVANPLASMLKKTTTSSGTTWYTNTLGMTISRWREIKYIGTQVAFKPLATNGSVDPAHIQQTAATNPVAATVQGAINPYDSNNHIHWRRWLGGNINIPSLANSSGDPTLAMRLDNYWLQDDRFNHANVNQGFETFVAPLRSKLTAGAMMSQGLFGYYSSANMATAAGGQPSYGDDRASTGLMGSLDEVEEQGWLPNPMAGLKYAFANDTEAGYEGDFNNVSIAGINTKFPWYGDVLDTLSLSGTLTTNVICQLIQERFMAPMLIVRIPPAYSTVYGWRIYISHNFAVRKPFMTASAWEVSQITEYTNIPIIRATVEGASDDDKREYQVIEKPISVIQALQVDPYADTEYPNTISMATNMEYLGHMWGGTEPRNANAYEVKPQTSATDAPSTDDEGMIPHT